MTSPLRTPTQSVDGDRFLRIRSVIYRLRQSLLFVPALMIAGSVLLSQVTLAIDRSLDEGSSPSIFETTVDSARAILGSIAGGTITAASVVFSLTLVAVQLSSSQFSPRTLGAFLGDRFQQLVIGVVLGSFSYSLLVLREVRGPLFDEGESVVPALSVLVAVGLALISLVSLLASINHTAQGLRVESVLERITNSTIQVIHSRYGAIGDPIIGTAVDEKPPPIDAGAIYVGAPRSGWIQQLSPRSIVDAVPEGSSIHLIVTVGQYVVEGEPLVYVAPQPGALAEVRTRLLGCLVVGERRTLQQDVGFGLLQLDDVALRALSPGVNDPNTAVDVVARIGSVLVELLTANSPPRVVDHKDRRLVRAAEPSHADFVRDAYGSIRRYARGEPTVLVAVAESLARARAEILRRRSGVDVSSLDREADLLRNEAAHLPTSDDRARLISAIDRIA